MEFSGWRIINSQRKYSVQYGCGARTQTNIHPFVQTIWVYTILSVSLCFFSHSFIFISILKKGKKNNEMTTEKHNAFVFKKKSSYYLNDLNGYGDG